MPLMERWVLFPKPNEVDTEIGCGAGGGSASFVVPFATFAFDFEAPQRRCSLHCFAYSVRWLDLIWFVDFGLRCTLRIRAVRVGGPRRRLVAEDIEVFDDRQSANDVLRQRGLYSNFATGIATNLKSTNQSSCQPCTT
jgi:hypothetical protein